MDKVQKTVLLACAVLIHCGILLFAQDTDYRFRHLTTEDGLPSNWIFHITQDSRGFFWMATRAGLCRYDGYGMKVYRHDPSDSTTISNDYLKCNLLEDSDGSLWVGTKKGLNRFDPKTEKFTRYFHDPVDSTSISSDIINCIYQDRKGTIWIGTSYPGGLNKYIPETNSFKCYRFLPEITYSNTYLGMYEDRYGVFRVATKDGLLEFDRDAGIYTLIETHPKISNKIVNRFSKITEDLNGNLWYVGDWIYKYDRDEKLLTLFEPLYRNKVILENTMYTDFEFDVAGHLPVMWVVNHGKLYQYQFDTENIIYIPHDPDDLYSIMASGLHNLYMDGSGSLWVGGVNGISLMDPLSGQVNIHKEFMDEYQDGAMCFLEDYQGYLWIGTRNSGVMQFDRDMNLVNWHKSKSLDPSGGHFDGRIWKIYEDSRRNLWIICNTDGLYFLDRTKNEISRCDLRYSRAEMFPKADEHFLNDVLEDSHGTLWLAASPSLYRCIPGTGSNTTFHLVTDPEDLYYHTITSILEDFEGGLWFSVFGKGLFYQPEEYRGTNHYIFFKHDGADINSLSNDWVWSVYEDDNHHLWMATNHGLNRFNRDKQSFERYYFKQEAGANFIYDVVFDKLGNLWMTTESGLVRIPRSDLANLGANDARIDIILPFKDIWTYNLNTDKTGNLYIGTKKGAQYGYFTIDPAGIRDNTHIPPIVLTDFRIQNKPVILDSSITTVKRLELKHKENYFSFEFAALDFKNPEMNQYAFMLEGLDEDWIYSGNRRFANYTKVPPGKYIFRVKGSNNNGYWNEEGASILISISPPPWATWWAYTGYGLLLILLLYGLRRYDLKRQRLKQDLEMEHHEAEQLKELDTMKSRFFANISHEFRTPLTLILGPLEKLFIKHSDKESREEIRIAQKSAIRLQRLIDQLLTLSRLEAGKLKLQARQEDLVSLVNGYFQSFESLAKQRNIHLEFHSDQKKIPVYVDRDKLEKILYNLLSNAFKFTPEGGRISVMVGGQRSAVSGRLIPADRRPPTADLIAGCAIISISDTGPGIAPEHLPHIFDRFYQADDFLIRDQEGTGIGLALAKELVELHHGEIRVESEVGKGTTFFVLLPLGSENLGEEGKRGRGEGEKIGRLEDWKIGGLDEGKGGMRNLKPGTQNSELKTQNSELKTQNSELRTQNSELRTDKPLLLIVEDNPDLLAYIKDYLEKDYRVAEALEGEEGLKEAMRIIPDLVISDVMMPKMDGFTLCRKLKTDERTSHIPVILLTARAAMEDKLEGLETGADDYIAKPFNPEELLARIKNLIRQRNVLREKFIHDFWKGARKPGLSISAAGLGRFDKAFLKKALDIAEDHLSDTGFNIAVFCKEMAMSRQQLHRKLRALMDQSPTEFVRTIRLKKAAELLAQKGGTVSEIAYDTGFNTLSYFTKCFKEQYGVNPSEFPPR